MCLDCLSIIQCRVQSNNMAWWSIYVYIYTCRMVRPQLVSRLNRSLATLSIRRNLPGLMRTEEIEFNWLDSLSDKKRISKPILRIGSVNKIWNYTCVFCCIAADSLTSKDYVSILAEGCLVFHNTKTWQRSNCRCLYDIEVSNKTVY